MKERLREYAEKIASLELLEPSDPPPTLDDFGLAVPEQFIYRFYLDYRLRGVYPDGKPAGQQDVYLHEAFGLMDVLVAWYKHRKAKGPGVDPPGVIDL